MDSRETRPTVIVIDAADDDFTNFMGKCLTDAGFATEIVRTGPAALDRLAGPATDLVIADLHLPIVSGLDVLEDLRANERWTGTFVVVTTSDPNLARVAQSRGLVDRLVLRPFSSAPSLVNDLANQFVGAHRGEADD